MNGEMYLVFLDDAGNGGLKLGVFTDRERALSAFNKKVEECQKEWDDVLDYEISRIDEPERKEVFWSQPGFGQTWHFDKFKSNEIHDIW